MSIISIQINYHTQWGESIYVVGSSVELGEWKTEDAIRLEYFDSSNWSIELDMSEKIRDVQFRFFVADNGTIKDREFGGPHTILLNNTYTKIECCWRAKPKQIYFDRSIFKNSIFKHLESEEPKLERNKTLLKAKCLHIDQSQELVIVGNQNALGNWDETKAISFSSSRYGEWFLKLTTNIYAEYKLAIRNKKTKKIVEWEDGDNRSLAPSNDNYSIVQELQYRKQWIDWKASGIAIPIFSLRSEKNFGIGEFPDLNILIDWASNAKMSVIQVLPINDTTATHSWIDSYPYNTISIYALHPIYLGLHEYPLKDEKKHDEYIIQAKKLNKLNVIDYNKVIDLKTEYIKALFLEIGEEIMKLKTYKKFYEQNKTWLFPYACFCHLRDKYKTSNISNWVEFKQYDKTKLKKYISQNKAFSDDTLRTYFTQYLLHKQLTDVKEYAYKKGVALKGDIPIGISPNSVEAWTEPHLFNLDSQTGAPPDAFSVNGQNWGFPTYNWSMMSKDNYAWWTKRFAKMADYFDAYRIDHILGFFRIWEIPKTSVYGLLGYFSPALPLSKEEINDWGFSFDEGMTVASIHKNDLDHLFGEYRDEAKEMFLEKKDDSYYQLKENFNTQRKIQAHFYEKNSEKDKFIRDELYEITNEVLFIRDKYETNKYHPRILLHNTLVYNNLNDIYKQAINKLYDNYFYHKHSQFWENEALQKLPTLINATDMLVCGEDLGMVPDSVPFVMNKLQILSLEIQRMPKELGLKFSHLDQLPYLSVATTSTHDMTPIRMWWKEERDATQEYYNTRLNKEGEAPNKCSPLISSLIIKAHLESPAMLTILPFQDWLAMSDTLRRENEDEERINVPSNPQHNWNYRMHITLENLVENTDFSDRIRLMNEESGR